MTARAEIATRSAWSRAVRALPWALVALGVAVRVAQWEGNLSLEMAEAALAMNVIERQPAQLLEPLARDQGAPIGFLVVEKVVIETWDARERAFRLFPLLCGVLSVIAFPRFARRYVGVYGGLIALGLFAVSPGATLASRLAKQYSVDIAAAVLLLWWAARMADVRPRLRDGILFGLGGSLALSFSHPAAFVLAGAGLVLAADALVRRDRSRFVALALAGASWAVTFGALYVISLRHIAMNEYLLNYWSSSFAPIPPRAPTDFHWFPHAFVNLFKETNGSLYPGLGAFLSVVGFLSLFSASRVKSLLLGGPALVALGASALHRYPFAGHLALFLVPSLLLLVGEGVDVIRRGAGAQGPALVLAACAFLFYDPVLTENRQLFRPKPYQEARPVIERLAARWREGDLVYLYSEARYPFEYYSTVLGFHPDDVVLGRSADQDWDQDLKDLEPLRGRARVWLLFHDPEGGYLSPCNEERFILSQLAPYGKELDSLRSVDASLHLYDLSGGQSRRSERREGRDDVPG